MKRIYLVISFAILLSACSPAEIFSQLATTEEEQAASQAIEKQKRQQEKLQLIETKKSSFAQSTLLSTTSDDLPHQAIAFRNDYAADGESIIEIEALVPDPDTGDYLAWVKSPNQNTYQKLGSLEIRETDDYFLSFSSQDDLASQSQIFISIEDPAVEQPQNIILAGEFPSF